MKKKKLFIVFLLFLTGSVITTGVLFYHGILWFHNPSRSAYPVQGVDVSSYQGEIDWEVLSKQDISFAFMKATEGSGFQDPYFASNWENASKTDLRIGAYHFFSFDSSGKTQAENFIATVPKFVKALPPVVDLEFYGDKEANPPSKQEVKENLNPLLKELEDYYGVKPILYVTKQTYESYVKDEFEEYDIWYRNIFSKPVLSEGKQWTFWQYSNREKLEGYKGKEAYIDKNVFYGSKEEFINYGI